MGPVFISAIFQGIRWGKPDHALLETEKPLMNQRFV
jgi:hypothetical protein